MTARDGREFRCIPRPTTVPDSALNAVVIVDEDKHVTRSLRSATSLAKFPIQTGRAREAHYGLASRHAVFTEGFDTADLKDAKALLDELK